MVAQTATCGEKKATEECKSNHQLNQDGTAAFIAFPFIIPILPQTILLLRAIAVPPVN